MRIDQLTRRLASAPRFVVIALVALSALISPGFVRVSPESSHGLSPVSHRTVLSDRDVAVLEVACPDGVSSTRCTRRVAELTRALEAETALFASVRSLANERVVRAAGRELRLEPLAHTSAEGVDAERLLRARLAAEPALRGRYLTPDGQATLVYAELAPGRSRVGLGGALASIAAAALPGDESVLTRVGVGGARAGRALVAAFALALAALAVALAPGGWRVALVAGLGAAALVGFAHALLGFLGEPARAIARSAPELFAAAASFSCFALALAARAEHRRERAARNSVATALAAVGPGLALAALAPASGLAALLAFAPEISLPLALAAAAALAAGLVAYPLGTALAALVLWPGLLARARGELASAVARRAAQAMLRPRLVASGALALCVAGALALAAFSPDPRALELRSVVLDSGARGGALEPEFLERVAAFQRDAAGAPGVVSASSLVDVALAPANRALHDGDALFATVPLTRVDVLDALEPWQGLGAAALAGRIDAEQRRVAVELLVAPAAELGAPLLARPLASVCAAVACAALVCGLALRSARGALACAAPAALAGFALLLLAAGFAGGAGSAAAALAPLTASLAAGVALILVERLRALRELGSQVEVALSLALREAGPALASAALGASALALGFGVWTARPLVTVALAGLAPLFAAAAALVLVPWLVRALRGRIAAERAALHAGVSG